MPTVFSANSSSVTVDGAVMEGLQSLAFRVVTEREDIREVGSDERMDVSFGLRKVMGELVVRSSSPSLDSYLHSRESFGIVANLVKQVGISTTSQPTKYEFDQCYIESKSFGLDANGTGVTTYCFSVTRLREGPGE